MPISPRMSKLKELVRQAANLRYQPKQEKIAVPHPVGGYTLVIRFLS